MVQPGNPPRDQGHVSDRSKVDNPLRYISIITIIPRGTTPPARTRRQLPQCMPPLQRLRRLKPPFILILPLLRPEDLLLRHRPYHQPKHDKPSRDHTPRHDAPNDLDAPAAKGLADGKRRRHERRIGKHEGVKRHTEGKPAVLARAGPMRARGHEEEPQREAPQPKAHPASDDAGDHGRECAVAHEARVDVAGEGVGHAEDGGDGEAARADGDEHARAGGLEGQFLRHEAVDEGGVDHEGDEEADALQGEAADDDVQGVGSREGFGELGGVRADDEEGVGGEDPDWGHGFDGEGFGGPPDWGFVWVSESGRTVGKDGFGGGDTDIRRYIPLEAKTARAASNQKRMNMAWFNHGPVFAIPYCEMLMRMVPKDTTAAGMKRRSLGCM